MRRAVASLVVALAFSACDTYHFLAGTWREDAGRPMEALAHYETFLKDRALDPRSCEVRLRAGEIERSIGRYDDARRHFEAAVRDFPRMTECVVRAKASLLSCPDYFPLDKGRTWVYGDSSSAGKAMRQEWTMKASSPSESSIAVVIFAGDRRFSSTDEGYVKADWALWHVAGKSKEPLLRYPYAQDQTWSAKRKGADVAWLVVSTTETVKVAAGQFSNCLKVRERSPSRSPSWRYDYYCPGVGRVKTTLGGDSFENPNTELLRFDKMD
jgi:tetratricopeptide (TPR) repeat protein